MKKKKRKIFFSNIRGLLTDEGIFSLSEASIAGMAIECYYDSMMIRKGKEISIYLELGDNTYTNVRIVPEIIQNISSDCYRVTDCKKIIYYLRRFP